MDAFIPDEKLRRQEIADRKVMLAFGRYAAVTNDTTVQAGSVSVPRQDFGGILVESKLVIAYGPAQGAASTQRLLTLKESSDVYRKEHQQLQILAHQLEASLREDSLGLNNDLGRLTQVKARVAIDEAEVTGLWLISDATQGIILVTADGLISWVAALTDEVPTHIFTENLARFLPRE